MRKNHLYSGRLDEKSGRLVEKREKQDSEHEGWNKKEGYRMWIALEDCVT